MNEIKRAKYNDVLIRATGQDVGPPAPYLAGEIVPVFPVEELTLDMLWAKGIKSFRARTSVTGAAGGVPAFRLSNPPGSGVLLIVEKFSIQPTTAFQISWGIIMPGLQLATPLNAINCDTRAGGVAPGRPASGAGKPTSEINQVVGNYAQAMWSLNGQANVEYMFEEELVITAGQSFDMYGNVNAVAAYFNCRWRERSVDDLELNA